MKLIKLVIALTLLMITGATSAMATEEAPYTVLKTDDIFELREYPLQVLVEIIVDGDLEDVAICLPAFSPATVHRDS